MTETVSGNELRAFVERVERLTEEREAISADIREVFAEAKSHGFDTKVMRQVVRIRRQDRDAWREQEAIRDLYLESLGFL